MLFVLHTLSAPGEQNFFTISLYRDKIAERINLGCTMQLEGKNEKNSISYVGFGNVF